MKIKELIKSKIKQMIIKSDLTVTELGILAEIYYKLNNE